MLPIALANLLVGSPDHILGELNVFAIDRRRCPLSSRDIRCGFVPGFFGIDRHSQAEFHKEPRSGHADHTGAQNGKVSVTRRLHVGLDDVANLDGHAPAQAYPGASVPVAVHEEFVGLRRNALALEAEGMPPIRPNTGHTLDRFIELKCRCRQLPRGIHRLLHALKHWSGAQSAKSKKNIPAPHVRSPLLSK